MMITHALLFFSVINGELVHIYNTMRLLPHVCVGCFTDTVRAAAVQAVPYLLQQRCSKIHWSSFICYARSDSVGRVFSCIGEFVSFVYLSVL